MDEANRRVHEALDRARTGQTLSNYPAIFAGCMAKGIAEGDIKPRESVFTFAAWKALGAPGRRGQVSAQASGDELREDVSDVGPWIEAVKLGFDERARARPIDCPRIMAGK